MDFDMNITLKNGTWTVNLAAMGIYASAMGETVQEAWDMAMMDWEDQSDNTLENAVRKVEA